MISPFKGKNKFYLFKIKIMKTLKMIYKYIFRSLEHF